MKTITREYQLYTFDELSQEAKDKARAKYNENNEYYFLGDNMAERLHELLEENKIKDLNDTSKAGTKPTPVFYSLSYSQGDGAMFEGNFVKICKELERYGYSLIEEEDSEESFADTCEANGYTFLSDGKMMNE